MKRFTLLSGLSESSKKQTGINEEEVSKIIDQLLNLPSVQNLLYINEKPIVLEKLKSAFTTIISEQNESHKPLDIKELRNRLVHGEYDAFIFSESPKLTEELKLLISKESRFFIQRLFAKCNSEKALRFWLDEQKVPLPKDTWGLVVNLGNNIHVLKYMKLEGYFDGLAEKQKNELLYKAERFPGEGLDYLKQEFSGEHNTFEI